MPKRTLFTNITPLPAEISREVAVAMLHDHDEMIELNPLVIEHHPIKTPRDAPADEFLDCVWQQLTDKIHYLPGGMIKGKVSYRACFHDLPRGLQTHIYAPMGLDIREKWSICGSLPGEPPEARELGLDVPTSGLYLREDGDMRCPRFLTSFVHKNLNTAHKVLVERILKKAQRIERHREAMTAAVTGHRNGVLSPAQSEAGGATSQAVLGPQTPLPPLPTTPTPNSSAGAGAGTGAEFQAGSHMAKSRIIHSPELTNGLQNPPLSPGYQHSLHHPPQSPGYQHSIHQQPVSPGFAPQHYQQSQQPPPNIMDHPAFKPSDLSTTSLPSQPSHSNSWSSHIAGQDQSFVSPSNDRNNAHPQPSTNITLPETKQYLVELPGSLDVEHSYATPYSSSSSSSPPPDTQRQSGASELSSASSCSDHSFYYQHQQPPQVLNNNEITAGVSNSINSSPNRGVKAELSASDNSSESQSNKNTPFAYVYNPRDFVKPVLQNQISSQHLQQQYQQQQYQQQQYQQQQYQQYYSQHPPAYI